MTGGGNSKKKEKAKVAYVMSRFPHLPETFILREMSEIEDLGWEVCVYPLIHQKQHVVHPEAQRFLAKVRYSAFLSIRTMAANISQCFRDPFRYLRIFTVMVRGNLSSLKFLHRSLVIFPKAVQMGRKMQAEGVDCIHAHYATHPALAAWIINRFFSIPFIVTVHAHDIFVERAMLYEKLWQAAHIITISDFNRKFLRDRIGEWVEVKCTTNHCGVFPEKYSSQKESRNGLFSIISTGSLQPYKGQKYLIEAARLLMERGVPFRCTIIGAGELNTSLSAQIQAAGLRERVELAGPKNEDEVAAYLKQADCYVQPSIVDRSGKMEGIPVSLMEAMATGVPVIASSLSGIPELVEHNRSGLLVPPGDPDVLAESIFRLWNDPALAAELAANGKEVVSAKFNVHKNAPFVSKLLGRLLHEQ
ncbi:MAG: glycosyltransferase family 4 protein [Anaerolineales bacterium]|nr:glycosyltransferase family 4 protein [Anaerolineales bacterium]